MSKAKVIQLWPIPVFEGNFSIPENIKQKFYNEEYERMPSENGAFSVNKYILDSSEYGEVRNKIMKCVNAYTHSFLKVSDRVKFYLQNSWIVKHEPNDWGQPHTHGNSLLSGVYYLNAPIDGGGIFFHHPQLMRSKTIKIESHTDNQFNTDTYFHELKKNSLLIFPSNLPHSTQVNKSNHVRFSLAFNYFIEGRFGHQTSKINLRIVK